MRASTAVLVAAARAPAPGPRGDARRRLPRPPSDRPAPEGPRGAGGRDQGRPRRDRRDVRRAARRCRPVRLAEPRRDGEHHHRRVDGEGDDGHRERRRASRRSSTSRTFLAEDGRAASRATGRARSRSKASTSSQPVTYEVMPDRLEAATFLFATAADGRRRDRERDMRPDHLEIVLEKLIEMGARARASATTRVRITMDGRPRAVDIVDAAVPGVPDRPAADGARDALASRTACRSSRRTSTTRGSRTRTSSPAWGPTCRVDRTPRGRPGRRRAHRAHRCARTT